jgi:5-methyltetrahydrofolate--homocysteine methyltransferase
LSGLPPVSGISEVSADMKHDIREAVRRKVVLFDGGMGSMCIAAGLSEWEIPEAWNVSNPDKIGGFHSAYIEAGAEVIQTNTFGASRMKLASSEAGRKLDVVEVNTRGVEIAREALQRFGDGERFLAGEIGPTGRFFPPVGNLTAAEARKSFKEQAAALESAGVDLFLIETMYDVREAVEALRAVKEVSESPVVIELTFEKKARGYFTLMGDTPEKEVETLLAEGADMIGANCTVSSTDMVELAGELRALTTAPLLFQPNAGRPVMEHGSAVYLQKPMEFAEDIEKIVRAGANAVGGCCGTTPAFIRAVHDRLIHGR